MRHGIRALVLLAVVFAMPFVGALGALGDSIAHGQEITVPSAIDLSTNVGGKTRIHMTQNDYGDLVVSYLNYHGYGIRALDCDQFAGIVLSHLPLGVFEKDSKLERVYDVNNDIHQARIDSTITPKEPHGDGVYDFWYYNSNWRTASDGTVPKGYLSPLLGVDNNYGQLRDTKAETYQTFTNPYLENNFITTRTWTSSIDGSWIGTERFADIHLTQFGPGSLGTGGVGGPNYGGQYDKHNFLKTRGAVMIYVSVPGTLPGDVSFSVGHVTNSDSNTPDDLDTAINSLQTFTMTPGSPYMVIYPIQKKQMEAGNDILRITYTVAGNPVRTPMFVYDPNLLSNVPAENDVNGQRRTGYLDQWHGGVKISVGSYIFPPQLSSFSNAFMISGYGFGLSAYGPSGHPIYPAQLVTALTNKTEVWVATNSDGDAPFVNDGVPYSELRELVINNDVVLFTGTDKRHDPDKILNEFASYIQVSKISDADVGFSPPVMFYTLTPFITTNTAAYTENNILLTAPLPPNSILIPRHLVDDFDSLTCTGFMYMPQFHTPKSNPFTLRLVEPVIPSGNVPPEIVHAFNITTRDLFPGGIGERLPPGNYSDPADVPRILPADNPKYVAWRSLNADGTNELEGLGATGTANQGSTVPGTAKVYGTLHVKLGFSFADFQAASFGQHPVEIPDCTVSNPTSARDITPEVYAINHAGISGAHTEVHTVHPHRVDRTETTSGVFFVHESIINEKRTYDYRRAAYGLGSPSSSDASRLANYISGGDTLSERVVVDQVHNLAMLSGLLRDQRLNEYYDPRVVQSSNDDYKAVYQITGPLADSTAPYEYKCKWHDAAAQQNIVLNQYSEKELRVKLFSTQPLYLSLLAEVQDNNALGLGDLSFGGMPLIAVVATFLAFAGFNRKHLPSTGMVFLFIVGGMWYFKILALPEFALAAILFVVVILIFNRGLRS